MSKRVEEVETDWVSEEFGGLDLGDARLNERGREVIRQFAAKPTASIPMACGGRAEMEAAYRLMCNEKASWDKISAPHWDSTEKRAALLCMSFPGECE